MLYSYCIPIDDGAAPNPFWNVCTLGICKPGIRKKAKVGDWIVGTGSKRYNFQNQVVYAMEVAQVLPWEKYHQFCKRHLPGKIPVVKHADPRRRAGDCQYKFIKGEWRRLKGIHDKDQMTKDLSGVNVLLSDHYYYFGSRPLPLPEYLHPIVKQGQSYKSKANDPYFAAFVDWILTCREARAAKNRILAEPYLFKEYFGDDTNSSCGSVDAQPC